MIYLGVWQPKICGDSAKRLAMTNGMHEILWCTVVSCEYRKDFPSLPNAARMCNVVIVWALERSGTSFPESDLSVRTWVSAIYMI